LFQVSDGDEEGFTSLRGDAVLDRNQDWPAVSVYVDCIAVPGDLAIVGFNDQEITSEISPSITTIRVPRYEIGRWQAR
jgi:hypothetical protein